MKKILITACVLLLTAVALFIAIGISLKDANSYAVHYTCGNGMTKLVSTLPDGGNEYYKDGVHVATCGYFGYEMASDEEKRACQEVAASIGPCEKESGIAAFMRKASQTILTTLNAVLDR